MCTALHATHRTSFCPHTPELGNSAYLGSMKGLKEFRSPSRTALYLHVRLLGPESAWNPIWSTEWEGWLKSSQQSPSLGSLWAVITLSLFHTLQRWSGRNGKERIIPEKSEAHTSSQDQDSRRKWPRMPFSHGHRLGVSCRHVLLGEFGEISGH